MAAPIRSQQGRVAMSDTSPRNPVSAPQMMADALLRTLSGCGACFRVTTVNCDSNRSELGLESTSYVDVEVGPAAMRRLKPGGKADDSPQWELLVSASGVHQQVKALELASAQSLFQLSKSVTIAGQSYLIEAFTSNEAFGRVYLYRLALRETRDVSS